MRNDLCAGREEELEDVDANAQPLLKDVVLVRAGRWVSEEEDEEEEVEEGRGMWRKCVGKEQSGY